MRNKKMLRTFNMEQKAIFFHYCLMKFANFVNQNIKRINIYKYMQPNQLELNEIQT